MLQLKLFRRQAMTPADLLDPDMVYQFSGNPEVLGIRFRPDTLRDAVNHAARLSLSPVLLGAETFLHLIEVADQTGLTLATVTMDPPMDESDEDELQNRIQQIQCGHGTGGLRAFLLHAIEEYRSVIKSVSFLVDSPSGRMLKVTVYNSGVLFVNGDDRALPFIDPAVSLVAAYRPGY